MDQKINIILAELKELSSAQCHKIYVNHGAPSEQTFGVKVGDLKLLVKKYKGNHDLGLALYHTGNTDAQYLAGYLVDPKKMSLTELSPWMEQASWYMLSEYMVPWVVGESGLALEAFELWRHHPADHVQAGAWASLNGALSHEAYTIPEVLLDRLIIQIRESISSSPNRVKYQMNAFIISLGIYEANYRDQMIALGQEIGKIQVDLGNTSCKVPYAPEYIEKAMKRATAGKKKKKLRC